MARPSVARWRSDHVVAEHQHEQAECTYNHHQVSKIRVGHGFFLHFCLEDKTADAPGAH